VGDKTDEEMVPGKSNHPKRRMPKPPPIPPTATAVQPRSRYDPADGPQFDRPTTRQSKRQAEEQDNDVGQVRKKAKRPEEVHKVGPPRRQRKAKVAK
jgi:hypothetical protein